MPVNSAAALVTTDDEKPLLSFLTIVATVDLLVASVEEATLVRLDIARMVVGVILRTACADLEAIILTSNAEECF